MCPIFDFYCKKCEIEEKDVFLRASDSSPRCEKCQEIMTKDHTDTKHALNFKGPGFFKPGWN